MIVRVQDIVIAAMRKIGVIREDEIPKASKMASAIQSANIMIDEWSIESSMIRSLTTDSNILTVGTSVYTIGPSGCAWTTSKPVTIVHSYLRDSSGVDSTILIVEQDQYDNYDDKSYVSSRPQTLYYSPGLSQQTSPSVGTIYLYPTPDAAYTLFIDSEKYLTEFVNPTDLVTFEPAYYSALVYNLAVRLFRDYHGIKTQMPIDLLGTAKSSKLKIERLNSKWVTARLDCPGSKAGRNYDIYSDT